MESQSIESNSDNEVSVGCGATGLRSSRNRIGG